MEGRNKLVLCAAELMRIVAKEYPMLGTPTGVKATSYEDEFTFTFDSPVKVESSEPKKDGE